MELELNNFGFLARNFRHGWRNYNLRDRTNFVSIRFFREKTKIYLSFRTLSERLWDFGGKFLAWWSKLHSTCPDEALGKQFWGLQISFLMKNTFWWNSLFRVCIRYLTDSVSDLWRKILAVLTKLHSTCADKLMENKPYSFKKSLFTLVFGFWARKHWLLKKNSN